MPLIDQHLLEDRVNSISSWPPTHSSALKTSAFWCSCALLVAACSSVVFADEAPYMLRPVCVRLLSDVAAFRSSFSRFSSDSLNGLTDAKLARIGQLAKIGMSYNDHTATCEFSDGTVLDFPAESFEPVENLECTVVGTHMHTRMKLRFRKCTCM